MKKYKGRQFYTIISDVTIKSVDTVRADNPRNAIKMVKSNIKDMVKYDLGSKLLHIKPLLVEGEFGYLKKLRKE